MEVRCYIVKNITAIIVLLTAFMVASSIPAFANSGPVYWQGYPSSDVMSVEEYSPIAIENENLIFDFSDTEGISYSLSVRVKATYEMLNPTHETQSVQMAFPFVGKLDSLLAKDIAITAEGSELAYDIYIGEVVDSHGSSFNNDEKEKASFDFASIISTITDDTYKAENFSENEKGKRYLIEVKPTTDQRINFAVDFSFNPEKTKVLTTGFNRYEGDGVNTRIAAWCYEPRTLEIFMLGEDMNFEITGFSDGELEEKTDLFTYQISEQEVELKPYLLDYIKKNTYAQNDDSIIKKELDNSQSYNNQLYNLYAKSLDQTFSNRDGYSSEYDLIEKENYERILTLVYTVEFPPNSTKEVNVSYRTTGTMDNTKTAKPLHIYDYLLNPAKNWEDFKNLNIEIITPQQAPYVVASSIELAREENEDNKDSYVYTATLPTLPEDDFTFTIYSAERITLLDKIQGSLNNSFGYFAPLVICGIVLIIIVFIIKAALRLRRHY